jgi:hypothetical protein
MELLIPLMGIAMPVAIVWTVMHFNAKTNQQKHDTIVAVSKNMDDPAKVEEMLKALDADKDSEGFFSLMWKVVKLVIVVSIAIFVFRCSTGDLAPDVNINGLADGDTFRIEVIEGEKHDKVVIKRNGEEFFVVEEVKAEVDTIIEEVKEELDSVTVED